MQSYIAIHEAGHAVVADALGLTVRSIGPTMCPCCDGRGEIGPSPPFNASSKMLVAAVPGVKVFDVGGRVRGAEIGERVHGICPDCAGSCIVGYHVQVDVPDEPTLTEHFLLSSVCLAGGLAQDRAGRDPDAGCLDDLDAAAWHVQRFVGAADFDDESMVPAMHRASALAQAIIDQRWQTIQCMADRLASDGELGIEGIAALLSEYRDGEMLTIGDEP